MTTDSTGSTPTPLDAARECADEVVALRDAEASARSRLPDLLRSARAAGYTWEEIANALGRLDIDPEKEAAS